MVSGKIGPFIDIFADVGYKLWTGKANEEVHSVTYGNTGRIAMDTLTYYNPITIFYTPKGDFPFNFAGWYRTKSPRQGEYWILTTSSNWVLSNQDIAYSFGGVLQPIFYKKNGATTIYFKSLDGVVSRGSAFTLALNGGIMYNIQPPTKEHYIFKGYYSQENGQGTKYYDENGKPVRKWNQSIASTNLYAYWEPDTHHIDLNGRLDGNDSGDLNEYGTCDIYINGVKVASDITDYYKGHPHGSRYEVKNIKAKPGKRYVGVSNGTLSGTITAFTHVYLEFRTETWEDYASDSYASGNGTETSPYIIKTPQQLGKLAKDSRSSNLSGKYYKLGANIDLSAHIWVGIGTGDYILRGNFNGDLYTISNIKTKIDYFINDFAGLFNRADATIRNVIVKDSNIESISNGGAILGHGRSQISNCIAQNVNVITSDGSAGGIVGGPWSNATASMLIESCTFKGGRIEGKIAGGIGGACTNSNVTIKDCNVLNATIKGSSVSNVLCGNISGGKILSSYGYGTVNATATKQIYGDSSAWGNWSYSPNLNGGYPVQKRLFALGGLTGSQNVYNYLTSTLKFSVA